MKHTTLGLFIHAAKEGFDYIKVAMDLVFTAGANNGTMQCVDVAIINSPTVEEDETFIVILTTSSSHVALGDAMTNVTIMDTNSMS